MKRNVMFSLFVIFLAAAIIGGATMAWFTAKADAPDNVFEAGTVMIDADKDVDYSELMENVNPGDCYRKCLTVENTGTKAIQLRLVDVWGEWEFDREWLLENWDALCFSDEALELTEPGGTGSYWDDVWADVFNALVGENPLFIAPCPDSDWVMKYVKEADEIVGFEFYYTGDLVEGIPSGESVTLCVVISFKGDLMDNVYQGATFNTSGSFEAVQSSNNAPGEVWGEDWNIDWLEMDDEEALRAGTSTPYADYFWVDGEFQFTDCCEENDEV